MKLTFDRDEVKARENLMKHKVPFDEGKTVFKDAFLLTYPDVDNSETEERYVNIGVVIENKTYCITTASTGSAIKLASR
jgi:hypothetical protein